MTNSAPMGSNDCRTREVASAAGRHPDMPEVCMIQKSVVKNPAWGGRVWSRRTSVERCVSAFVALCFLLFLVLLLLVEVPLLLRKTAAKEALS